jgi:hypothetical protein
LLRRVDRIRELSGESRSSLVGRALRMLMNAEENVLGVQEYVRAYREHPEGPGEVALARALTRRSLTTLPWDEERSAGRFGRGDNATQTHFGVAFITVPLPTVVQ